MFFFNWREDKPESIETFQILIPGSSYYVKMKSWLPFGWRPFLGSEFKWRFGIDVCPALPVTVTRRPEHTPQVNGTTIVHPRKLTLVSVFLQRLCYISTQGSFSCSAKLSVMGSIPWVFGDLLLGIRKNNKNSGSWKLWWRGFFLKTSTFVLEFNLHSSAVMQKRAEFS